VTLPLRLGVDLGGTKIEIAALAPDGTELLRRRIPTPKGDYEATLDALVRLVTETERALGGRGTLGLGMPGSLSRRTGLVKNANSTCLIGHALKEDLEARLHREVRVANDANCFALSEAADGAGAGAETVFGVILGTGVGGGIVVRGAVLAGANAIAGEWGHTPLPLPEGPDLPLPDCYCGRRGCLEAYLSGPALARDHAEASGQTLTPPQIIQGAIVGDAACAASLARYEERLARGLAGVINLLDPDVIVLGGGLSNIPRLYGSVPGLWAPHVFSDEIATRLVPNRHGDSSGVRGAARLWGSGGG
jgi:predicted NBD/HSP70 family sugar kinase